MIFFDKELNNLANEISLYDYDIKNESRIHWSEYVGRMAPDHAPDRYNQDLVLAALEFLIENENR